MWDLCESYWGGKLHLAYALELWVVEVMVGFNVVTVLYVKCLLDGRLGKGGLLLFFV